MKRWMKWTLAVVALAALAASAGRILAARKQQQAAVAAAQAAPQQPVIALAATDVVQVQFRLLTQTVAVSGALRAVNSAIVKARVAGELQGLTVREGDTVKAGQVLARIDTTEYKARQRQAAQQADAAKAQVDIARRAHDNNRSLVDQGFISRTALESSAATLAAAEASYQAAQAAADVTTKALDDAVLRAPLSGVVSQRLAQPGERMAIDGRVLEIVDLSRLEMEASLTAADSLRVQTGQRAQLQIEGATQPVAATVARINPSAMSGSRAVLAYLTIAGAPGLRQGLFAQGNIATGQSRSLTLPPAAIRNDKPEPYVQLISDGKIVHQPVVLGGLGEFEGQYLATVTGLPEGAVAVAGSVGALRAGTRVTLALASAPTAGGAK